VIPVLEVENLTKIYRHRDKKLKVLDNLNLTIYAGSIFGLLGPNGAGKSTFLRIILGLVHPDAGTCRLFGVPINVASGALRSIGSLIETTRLYPFLTGDETLAVLASYSGVRCPSSERRDLLARTGLADTGSLKVGEYSLGMKQRLGIACALINRPKLIILDEPTNGLDPAGIIEMRELFRELVELDGISVMLSSHMLDEVQRMCDNVAILNHGRIAAQGAVADLIERRDYLIIDAEPFEQAVRIIGNRVITRLNGQIKVAIKREDVPSLLASLTAAGINLYEAKWIDTKLEDYFIELTGSIRDDH